MENNNVIDSGSVILIVDDEPEITKLLERILTMEGHTVALASNGDEAVRKAEEVSPDLILMDITMPDMDGYEATSRIKNLPALQDTPVIFLTGKNPDEDGGRSFAVGGAAFLCKPFKEHQIRDIVNLALKTIVQTS